MKKALIAILAAGFLTNGINVFGNEGLSIVNNTFKFSSIVEKNIDRMDDYINLGYAKINVPSYFDKDSFRALILVESGDNPRALGFYGERGLCQLKETTWNQVEENYNFHKEAFDPNKNIEVSLKYIKWLDYACKIYNPNWDNLSDGKKRNFVIVAYNGGIGHLNEKAKWDIQKMPEGAQNYLVKIDKCLEEIFNP